tara:strand:+ start:145 stop:426 length:282 start_codon:yes stop_codon:yes gene_type:complete
MSAATQIINFLQNYNAWRRGFEGIEMPHPAEIGANIQDAIVLLRKHDQLERRIERLTIALKDAISTYDPNRKETLVTAERQEAWQAALKEDVK